MKCLIPRQKKGALTDVIIWIIIVFVVGIFFALWSYGHGIITDELVNSNSDLVANASKDVVKPANDAIQSSLDTIGIMILLGMIVSIFVSNFLIKGNPIFFVLYVIIAVIGVIFSATVSNRYMELADHNIIGQSISDMTATSFVMQYLPYFAVIIAIMGGLFLYLGIIREKNEGIGV